MNNQQEERSMDHSSPEYLKRIIEAILFVSEKPVMLEQFRDVLGNVTPQETRALILQMKAEFEDNKRGMDILEIAGGFQMLSSPEYAAHLRQFFKTKVKERLSKPALETLAIIAYKQPVSRGDIEVIRSVNSDGVVIHLLERGLVKVVGRKDVPGRPFLYGTTKQFMEYFGLRSLEDLPKLENFESMLRAAEDKENAQEVSQNASVSSDQNQQSPEAAEQKEETVSADAQQETALTGESLLQSEPEVQPALTEDPEGSQSESHPDLQDVLEIIDPEKRPDTSKESSSEESVASQKEIQKPN